MPKRRVMQLVLSLAPGGTERLVIEICKQLSDRVESVVCCLDQPGEWAGELSALGIAVYPLGRQPGFQPSLARKIARLITAHKIEVVHCHHYSPFVYGWLASLLKPVRLVYTEHGRLSNGLPSRKRQWVNPLLSLRDSHVCAVSGDLRDYMIAEGFPARRVDVLYNGIRPGARPTAAARTAARAALGLPHEAFVVGTVGRLDPVKNLEALLRAHVSVLARCPSARTVIIGDGPERANLVALAASLGISDSIDFTGYRADVRALMPAFDGYVNSSHYEGVSLTILEAMAATLPVVATDVGGNPEVVVERETGYLVAERPQLIADAISRLAADPRQRRVMGDAGRFRVKKYFSFERMVEEYAAVYRTLPPAAPSAAPSAAPNSEPVAAETISVSDATRSTV